MKQYNFRTTENHWSRIRVDRVYAADIVRFMRRYFCRRPIASRKVIIRADQSRGIYMYRDSGIRCIARLHAGRVERY